METLSGLLALLKEPDLFRRKCVLTSAFIPFHDDVMSHKTIRIECVKTTSL